MAYVGEKAVSSKGVKVICPHCGAMNIEKIYFFKSDIYENVESTNLFRCFNCKQFYCRFPDGACRKL